MKSKPIVYFSARHTLSPAMGRAMTSLSRHVAIIGQSEDPETAYSSINDCDVFLLYLHVDISQKLFLIYELGVALVLRKPIIVIRQADLKFSEIFIPKHFHEINVLVTPSTSSVETCNVFGMVYNLPLTLKDVMVYAYDTSMILCPEYQAKYIALLVDKIFGMSGQVESSLKKPNNLAISTSKSGFNKRQISPLTLKKYESDKLKTNLLRNEDKLDKFNEDETSANHTPEISISQLSSQDEYLRDKKHSKDRIEPVQPVISELQDTPREERRLNTSESTCDVTCLNDKTIASANTSPLPSPISPREIYYPTALPVYPMELCFPPFQIEKLHFDKYALQIAKTDRFPSIVRRRVMRKEL